METSYLLLIITCFCYGASGLITHWADFSEKLINTLALVAIFVLTILTCEDGFFSSHRETVHYWWLDIVLPIPAVLIGLWIGDGIDSDDWQGIFTVLAVIGLIATIITTCCGV